MPAISATKYYLCPLRKLRSFWKRNSLAFMLCRHTSMATVRMSQRLLLGSYFYEEGDNFMCSFFYTASIKSCASHYIMYLSVEQSIAFPFPRQTLAYHILFFIAIVCTQYGKILKRGKIALIKVMRINYLHINTLEVISKFTDNFQHPASFPQNLRTKSYEKF